MIRRTYDIEFLTPCFCAGAEQTRAELRPASIRGQLRWWFRALGGTLDEERAIFGGVHDESPTASTIAVRVVRQPYDGSTDWHRQIPQQGMHPRAYLLGFFCGRTGRLSPTGAISPGSKAIIEILLKRPPAPRLEQALRTFFSIGALGFRITRAAGAFTSKQHSLTAQSWQTLTRDLQAAGFHFAIVDPGADSNWVGLLSSAGNVLKNKLRSRDGLGISAGRNGSAPNALGSATPRQASVLHFRPVRIDGRLRLALIEAPHEKILGQEARRAHGNRGPIVTMAQNRRLLGA